MVTTPNGGLSWTGATPVSDPLLEAEVKKADQQGETGWARKAGWGIACRPDAPNQMVAVFGAFPSIFVSHDGGLNWTDTGADCGTRGCVYWHSQDPAVVYAADRRSVDGGKS